jgi:hypothetical protein
MLLWIFAATVGCWLGLGLLALCACIIGGRAEVRARQIDEARRQEDTETRTAARAAMF